VAAGPTLAVVPPAIDAQARGPGDGRSFVSSGAYVPVEQDLVEVRLEANDRYWAGPPAIDSVTVITDDGGRSNVDVFEDGAVDWTRIGENDASWIRYDRNLGPQLRHAEEMAVRYLGFDTTTSPFDDPAVRRAVAMAVDWRGLDALAGEGDEPPTSMVPPGTAGRGEGDHLLPYDPQAARAELTAAGYPAGEGFPEVVLSTYGVGPAGAIAADLASVLDIDVRVEQRDFDDHWALLERGGPDMWTAGWSADYPHAHDFLDLLLRTGSSVNLGGWSDARFDQLIDAAAATADPDEQQRLYDDAQAIVRDEAPVIPLGYDSSWWLGRDGLRGGHISGVGVVRFAEMDWSG
jgi:oligopeptide transport system substrate-binding protein